MFNKKVGVILLVLICLVNLPYFTVYYTSFSKEDWRGMSQELSELTSDGDYVVTVPSYVNLPLDYYYDKTHLFYTKPNFDTLKKYY